MEGLVGKHHIKNGNGNVNESKTEIKWETQFEKPYFFEKSLKWKFALVEGNKIENGEISFTIDKSKAMGYTFKKSLNKSIKIDQGEIKINSISASPTSTYVKGTIQDIFQFATDEFKGEGFRLSGFSSLKLIANGKEVIPQGGNVSTNINGITFEFGYDALPKDLKTLLVKLDSFQTDNKINREVELAYNQEEKTMEILGQKVDVNKVYKSAGKTFVTITTKEDVLLSKVYMMIDGKKVELKNTIEGQKNKNYDGSTTYTRTLCFEDSGENLKLEIKGIIYNKSYNKLIDIPID